MTAQLYQRNLPSSGTPWKEEHCGINRYSHIITSLVFTGNSVKYVVSEGVCVCVCEQQSYRSSLAEQPTRTSLDLELDLQACRTRQRQLMEELSALRELKLRLEEPQAREDPELPHWALRDERFRCLLREAQRQVGLEAQHRSYCSNHVAVGLGQQQPLTLPRFVVLQASQSKQEQRQEEAAERRLRKASKEVLQMRGQSQKEPLPVQTFRLGLY